ncbi:hypothetical protein [Clostridium sp.]|uniref:hypothetical protein n=1 Tax=Clostridium sp. TaxID=1506 RepID=UPI0026067361|nr:hypothetical protein [Clostridium sp.]
MLSHGVKLSKNTPINVWNSPSQKTRFREIYKRLQKQDHMIVKTWEKKVQVISKKMGRGMLPSVEEKEVLNIDKLRQNFNTYLPVNSSWIKAARYSDKKKELTLKLSGRKIKPYTFYNVPY